MKTTKFENTMCTYIIHHSMMIIHHSLSKNTFRTTPESFSKKKNKYERKKNQNKIQRMSTIKYLQRTNRSSTSEP